MLENNKQEPDKKCFVCWSYMIKKNKIGGGGNKKQDSS